MKIILIHIKTALVGFFRALPRWFRSRYMWALLLVPVIWSIGIDRLADANAMGWSDSATNKAFMEILHPALLATGVLFALAGWLVTRNTSLAFLSVLCAFLLSRELGGQGTSIILYLGLVGLITYGYFNFHKLETLLGSRFITSCIATGFIIYAVTQMLDRGIIKRLGWLFTWDTSWRPPYSSQMEESLESLGGSFLLLAVLVTIVIAVRQSYKIGQISPTLAADQKGLAAAYRKDQPNES